MSWSIRTVLPAPGRSEIRRAAAPVVLVCALLLGAAGCSRTAPAASLDTQEPALSAAPAPPAPPDPTADEVTAETPDAEPSSAPTKDAPESSDPLDRSELLIQPPAMRKANRAGAVAAAKYYMGLYEYVYLTGDLEMWEQMAEPSCAFCQVVTEKVTELHADGSHRVSGPPLWHGKPSVKHAATLDRWDVTLQATVSSSSTFDADGKLVAEADSGPSMVTLAMSHNGDHWRTVDIKVFDVE